MKEQLSKLIKKVTPANNFVVITVRLNARLSYSLQFISDKSSTLSIGEFYPDVQEEELIKHLKPEIPVLLSFQGDKVLSKDIEQSAALSTLLFNEDKEDFYISQFQYGDTNYVSIVRRKAILKALEILKNMKITVLDFSIGPFVGLLLKDIISDSHLFSDEFRFDFSDSENTIRYQKQERVETPFQLGDDELNQFQIPLIGTYLNYKNQTTYIEGKTDVLSDRIKEYRKHQIFMNALMVLLFTILVCLITSAFLRDRYQTKYVEAEAQLFFLEKSYNEIISLKKEKEQLQSLVSNLSGFSEEYYTHYVYYLVKTIPNGMRLDYVDLNPVLGKLTKGKNVKFSQNQIILKGTVDESKYLSEWTQVIKEYGWVKSIEVIELYQNRKDKLLFTLQVDF